MIVGAQGYTIRDFCKDEAGIASSLKKLGDIGFRILQVSAFGDIDRQKLRDLADQNGLSIVLTHTPPDRIRDDTDAVIREHEIMGCKNIGIGAMPGKYRGTELEGVRTFLKDFGPAAQKLADKGMKLHYHNHGFEFARVNGPTWLEIMAEETDPAQWGFTLDVYWSSYAGMNPIRILKLLQGRIDCCHLKDMTIYNEGEKSEQRMAPVMEGNLEWEAILPVCESTGISYALIEQDNSYGRDPFDELRISYENLKKAGCKFQ